MEPGYPVEWLGAFGSTKTQGTWVPGLPVYGTFAGDMKVPNHGHRPITTYRCVGCSYLESYAGKPR